MSDTITFETAALADVVGRAHRVAPSKGAAWDRAGGILLEYDPTEVEPVSIKATDLDTTFIERMKPLDCTIVDPFTWRIPSHLIAGITAGLPLGTETKLENKSGVLHITCGKSKAKIRLYATISQQVRAFDESGLVNVPGFAARVAQVAWACDKEAIPFTGIFIDGKRLIATDRYRLATVPCVVPVDEPISVPLDILTQVSKNAVDARLAAVGKRLHVMPSPHAQVTSVIYDTQFPPLERAMYGDDQYDASFTVDRDTLRNAIHRMLVLVKGERYPLMRLTIGQGRCHVLIDVEEVGEMEDEVEVKGADHPDFVMLFTPMNFVDGLMHAGKNDVKLSYNTARPTLNMRFEDGDGYECWIVPRHPNATSSAP